MFNGIATLIFYTIMDGEIIENTIPTYAQEKSVTRQERLVSYQTNTDSAYVYDVRSEDYELTKHIDKDTKKPIYASRIMVEEAVFDIVHHYSVGNGKVELTCS